ncbi:MAG: serine hydrolase [Gemmatimonadetes bacterium]|nr:serine hydrolase [Gemmatimonadota bacterium]
MRLVRSVPAALAALVLFSTPSLAQRPRAKQTPDPTAAIDSVVQAYMAEWKVPGVGLGIIRNGRVYLQKGYGYRDVAAQLPITPKTLLAIGSNTKSFTVVLIGLLADQGKQARETPVKTNQPGFRMYDPYATEKLTPRDLVNHRSGLPRHDLLWYGRNFSRAELVARLQYLEPTHSFREVWQYQNLMFAAAGHLTETLTGRSWDDQIRDAIFKPLGMTRSLPQATGHDADPDHATPYELKNGRPEPVPVRFLEAAGPAGSIHSTVEDMLKYVAFRMSGGNGTAPLKLSARAEREMQSPQMVVPGEGYWPGFDLVSYGLGLVVASYRGHRAVLHGGSIDGFISQMAWLPDDSIGVVVLSNRGSTNPIPTMIVQAVADRLLGLPPLDHAARQRKADSVEARQADSTKAALAAGRKTGTTPSHPLADYVGRYTHPGYGTVVVRQGAAGLEIALDRIGGALTHYHYDTFESTDATSLVPFTGLVTFQSNAKGGVDRVLVPVETALPPVVFVREP